MGRLSRRELVIRAGLATAGIGMGGVAINELAPIVAPERLRVDVNNSYWSRVLPPANPPLRASIEADVVVIGGGLTGLSAACYLRQLLPGKRVVLLEAHRCGNGASARNGAMLLTSTADRYLQPSADPTVDRRLHELTVENIATLRTLQATVGMDAEIETPGAVHVLRSADDARQAAADAARLTDSGIPVEYWSREQTAAAIGTDLYAGALFIPAAGQLHPGKLIALWKRAAQTAGVEVYEQSIVAHVDEGATHTLTTASGNSIRTPVLVLATNAYSSALGYLRRAAAAVWDYVAITPPLTAAQLAGLAWKSRAPFDDDHTEVYYLGLTRDNRVHIGGGPVDYLFNGGTPAPDRLIERHRRLHTALVRLYPSLADVPFEVGWGGAVDVSLDDSPAVGRMGRNGNVYYAIGYSGHGVNLTSVFGRILAELIAGQEERWRWLPYLNRLPPYLPNEPFRWLGIRAELAVIRTLDR
jgi:glycine/D-amino acid oxidase-like deaminating enzyme